MLRTENSRQLSFYSSLYEKIPESHLLKKIAKAVDFSFINELLQDRERFYILTCNEIT